MIGQTFGTNRLGDFWGTDFRLMISPTSFARCPLNDVDLDANIDSSVMVIDTSLSSFAAPQSKFNSSQSSFDVLVANILSELPLAMYTLNTTSSVHCPLQKKRLTPSFFILSDVCRTESRGLWHFNSRHFLPLAPPEPIRNVPTVWSVDLDTAVIWRPT